MKIVFKIKETAPLSRLMSAYCAKQGIDKNSVRFLYDGQRIEDTSTAKQVRLPCCLLIYLALVAGHGRARRN